MIFEKVLENMTTVYYGDIRIEIELENSKNADEGINLAVYEEINERKLIVNTVIEKEDVLKIFEKLKEVIK